MRDETTRAPGAPREAKATMAGVQIGRGLCVGALLLTCASGCAQKKIAECNALITVINSGVQSLEKASKVEIDPTGVSDLKSMADAMDKVATDTANVPLTVSEVRRFSTEYQKMVKEIAKAERDLAAAAQERDPPRRTAAEAALEAAVKQEDPLVDTINKFCQEN
jgi:hypothetical protein